MPDQFSFPCDAFLDPAIRSLPADAFRFLVGLNCIANRPGRDPDATITFQEIRTALGTRSDHATLHEGTLEKAGFCCLKSKGIRLLRNLSGASQELVRSQSGASQELDGSYGGGDGDPDPQAPRVRPRARDSEGARPPARPPARELNSSYPDSLNPDSLSPEDSSGRSTRPRPPLEPAENSRDDESAVANPIEANRGAPAGPPGGRSIDRRTERPEKPEFPPGGGRPVRGPDCTHEAPEAEVRETFERIWDAWGESTHCLAYLRWRTRYPTAAWQWAIERLVNQGTRPRLPRLIAEVASQWAGQPAIGGELAGPGPASNIVTVSPEWRAEYDALYGGDRRARLTPQERAAREREDEQVIARLSRGQSLPSPLKVVGQ